MTEQQQAFNLENHVKNNKPCIAVYWFTVVLLPECSRSERDIYKLLGAGMPGVCKIYVHIVRVAVPYDPF